MKITNKKQMYDLYLQGALGNALGNWNTLAECIDNCNDSKVGLRCCKINGPCVTEKTKRELIEIVSNLYTLGWLESDFIFGESPDHSRSILQGEVCRSERFIDLTYTYEKLPMRSALAKEAQYTSGICALSLLNYYMDTYSYNNLMYLFDTYEDAVVEFSSFDCSCGNLGWNTIFWEVRNY